MSPRARRPRVVERYRRHDALVAYWRNSLLIGCNYLTRIETPLSADIIDLLELLGEWTSPARLVELRPDLGARRDVARLLEFLADRQLIVRQSRASGPSLSDAWRAWHPEAAFFHFGTKNGRFRTDPLNYHLELVEKAKRVPPPSPTKSIAGAVTALPPPRPLGTLGRALGARRTWRRFGQLPVPLTKLATLLRQTFGVQAWGDVPGQGQVVVKTSPSGGSRHPIEAYVVAIAVESLPTGTLHHYDAVRHELRRLPSRLRRADIPSLLGHQAYFSGAAALVVMAPVFARTMWRYRSSHGYRTILVEAGHLGQTFCLIAALLDLAPFGTIALAERRWEELLGLDGISESPVYVVGVGTKPRDRQQPGWVAGRPTLEAGARAAAGPDGL